VRARRFELVDDRGRVRMVLGTQSDNGAPGLLVSDSAGRPRIALHVSPEDAPAFDLLDESGAPRIHVALDTDGAPMLTLFGSTERATQAWLDHKRARRLRRQMAAPNAATVAAAA